MRGRSVATLAAAGLTAFSLTGFTADREPGARGAQATPVAGAELFVQSAGRGILRRLPGHKRTYRLALKGLGSPVTVFTDRPARRAGSETTAQFVKRWRSRGFVKSPPNAALALSHASRRNDVKVFEISRPRLNRHTATLSFRAVDLGGKSSTALSGFASRADRRFPRRFRSASLFIDSSSTALNPQYLELQVHDGDRTRASLGFDSPAQIVLQDRPDTFFTPFDYGMVRLQPRMVQMFDGTLRFFVQPGSGPITGTATVDGSGQVLFGGVSTLHPLRSGRFTLDSRGNITQ